MRRLCNWWSSFDEDGQRVLSVVLHALLLPVGAALVLGVCLVDVWVGGTGW